MGTVSLEIRLSEKDAEYLKSLALLRGASLEGFVLELLREYMDPAPNKKEVNWLFGFEEFWSEYPNKKAKPRAQKAWKRLRPSKEELETIMTALRSQSKFWKENMNYIPYPASWLNERRWEDEIEYAGKKQNSGKFDHLIEQ